MRITELEVIVLEHSWGPVEDGVVREWPLVLVHTDEGVSGQGRGGDPAIIREQLAPLLLNQDPRRTSQLWQLMYDHAWRFSGPGMSAMASIGAIDVALWDLHGKALGEPAWRMMGGFKDRVDVYADGIGYSEQDPETVAGLVKKHADAGFSHVKFHLSSYDNNAALAKVRLSRKAVGPDVRLMLDAHRMWHGNVAVEMARAFEPYGLYWIEEPVRGDDEPRFYSMVREATSAMVAGGEGDGTLGGARRLITEGGLQLLQTDILIGGGYTGLLRFAALAQAYHVPLAPHGAQYPDVSCQLAAAVPNGLIIPACPDIEPYEIWSKLYSPRLEIDRGQIAMSDRPGLGLDLDWEFIDRHRVDR